MFKKIKGHPRKRTEINTENIIYIEEEPHLSCAEHSCYKIYTKNVPMETFSLRLMKWILADYTVFTQVFGGCSDMVLRAQENMGKAEIRTIEKGDTVTIVTTGMNEGLVAWLHSVKIPNIDLAYMQSAFKAMPPEVEIGDCESAMCHIWMKYSMSAVYLGIDCTVITEKMLIERLRAFTEMEKTRLEVVWQG